MKGKPSGFLFIFLGEKPRKEVSALYGASCDNVLRVDLVKKKRFFP